MSDGMFLLVLVALGFVFLIYFHRRARKYRDEHPGKDNPVERWMTGETEQGEGDARNDPDRG